MLSQKAETTLAAIKKSSIRAYADELKYSVADSKNKNRHHARANN